MEFSHVNPSSCAGALAIAYPQVRAGRFVEPKASCGVFPDGYRME